MYLALVHVLGLVVAQGLGQAEHKSRFPGTLKPRYFVQGAGNGAND